MTTSFSTTRCLYPTGDCPLRPPSPLRPLRPRARAAAGITIPDETPTEGGGVPGVESLRGAMDKRGRFWGAIQGLSAGFGRIRERMLARQFSPAYPCHPRSGVLDFSIRRQVTIHWGVLPANEQQNHRPAGTIGCEIQYARGGIPTDESQWQSLDTDTDSPFTHFTNETTPITFAYRARYIGKHLKHGSFCDPAICTVSV